LVYFYNFPLTLINEKFTFQTELIASQVKFNQAFNSSLYFNNIEMEYKQAGIALLLKYEMFQKKSFHHLLRLEKI
jgi:hypothetical protein